MLKVFPCSKRKHEHVEVVIRLSAMSSSEKARVGAIATKKPFYCVYLRLCYAILEARFLVRCYMAEAIYSDILG